MSINKPKRAILYLALAVIAILVLSLAASNTASTQGPTAPLQTTTLSIDPTPAEVSVGGSIDVDIVVTDVVDLYGAALNLTFDPSIVQVVGAALTPGTCPQPDFVLANTADNMAGTIEYSVTSLAPAPPCNGSGVVATITFDKIAAGTSPVHFDSWLLADTDGLEIPADVVDGEITDPAGPGAVLSVDPTPAAVAVGNTIDVDIVVTDVADLYGAALTLTFDPSIVQVVGAALTPGTCPQPDFVLANTADNMAGTIEYSVTSLAPAPPCNGTGVIATITFDKIAAGTSPVHFDTWLLADTNGVEIPATAQDGQVIDLATAALLWLDPQFPAFSSGSLDLRLDDVSNVYGIEVALSYDPAVIDVPSGHVTPGVCPQPDFVAANTAGGGSISYAATQLFPTAPCNGGVVATIDLVCDPALPVNTDTDVIITSSIVADPDGASIAHSTQNATVTCLAESFDVVGTVGLQAWPHGPAGVEVTLYDDTEGVMRGQAVVGADGAFSLSGKVGNLHTLTASYPRYLDVAQSGLTAAMPGDVVDVGHANLPAGDLNDDGVINILDLSVVGGNFTKTSPQPWSP